MTSSQRAMVTVERKKTDPAFAEQWELMEQEAKERQKAAGAAGSKGGRGKKKTLPEQIREGFEDRHDRETTAVLAKVSGTNAKYLELSGKIYDEHPEYVEPIKRGTRPPGNEGHRSGAALARSRQAALIEMQRAAARRVMLSTIVVVHFQP